MDNQFVLIMTQVAPLFEHALLGYWEGEGQLIPTYRSSTQRISDGNYTGTAIVKVKNYRDRNYL